MSVSYDGKKLIPAPFISIQREHITREDGTPLSSLYTLVVKGKLLADRGSPNSQGVFHQLSGYPANESLVGPNRFGSILAKQKALQNLFATDGRLFEVQASENHPPLKFRPRIRRVDIPEGEGRGGNWTEYCEYIITMEADSIDGLLDIANSLRVSKVSEDWSIEILDENRNTYRLSHSVSATGRRLLDDSGNLLENKQAWEHARDHVLNTPAVQGKGIGLGLKPERMEAPGVLNASSLQAFNYLRTQSIGEAAGTFAVNETWVCFDPQGQPPAVSEYNIVIRSSTNDNRTTVSVDGSITGLEVRDNTTHDIISTRWDNAYAKWTNHVSPNLFTTAQSATATILNPIPLSSQQGQNRLSGTITYTYEFDNRPVATTPGALSESITIQDVGAADVFATLPVLGRPLGPILQGIGTKTAKKRTINIEIQMPPATTNSVSSQPNTNTVVLLYLPPGTQVYLEQDDETWTPLTGRYTRNTVYVWV
jgi:hypothetical protein